MSANPYDVSTGDVLDFAAQYPLAWIVPKQDPSGALLMPLLIETDPSGAPASVLGHLPKRAPATEVLRRDGSAILLFLGPHAYIQPSWVSKEDWAPTWNFLSLKIETVSTRIDDTLTRPAVEALVAHMETRVGSDWTTGQIGPRYETLLSSIVGFRSEVSSLTPRFKMGQDETDVTYSEIRQALGDHPLAGWMG